MPKISSLNAGVDATPTGADIVPIVQGGVSKRTSLSLIVNNVLPTGAALTKTDDTNVTLTFGGSHATGLLRATSVTVGWIGTLAAARLNANVVQSIVNDTNVTGSIATQALTFSWAGTLAVARGGTGAGDAAGAKTSFGFATTSTDNAAAKFDSTAGNTQNSALIIADTTGAISRSGDGGIPVQGTNTNDDAAAGDYGEYSAETDDAPQALTSTTPLNVNTISLTAGDWDLSPVLRFTGNAATTVNLILGSLSTTSATQDQSSTRSVLLPFMGDTIFNFATPVTIPLATSRFSLSATTTIYLVAQATFATNTMSVAGTITARRVR